MPVKKHQVLNAKYHEKEAEIVALAGEKGAVTIATNMAGRGTDIILGGNSSPLLKFIETSPDIEEQEKIKLLEKVKLEWQKEHDSVLSAGGLKVIGFEKNENVELFKKDDICYIDICNNRIKKAFKSISVCQK